MAMDKLMSDHIQNTAQTQRVTAITCMRNDGSYVLEWIAHHLALGVEHFVVLTHDCTDGTPELLNALQEVGLVTHLPFIRKGKVTAQWQAFKLAWLEPRVQSSDWVMFFDCDEFLWLDATYPKLQDLLKDIDTTDAIALPWRLFGSDGVEARGGEITPRRFQKSAPVDLQFPMGHLIKTLFRPSKFSKPGVHRPKRDKDMPLPVWAGPDGAAMTQAFVAQEANISLFNQNFGAHIIGLNHYSLRSMREFAVKADRGLPNHMSKIIGVDYWVERNWNTEENTRILPQLEATEAVLADLLCNDYIWQAHQVCLDHYVMRDNALDLDLQKIRLIWQLSLLSENRLPSRADVKKYINQQNVARKSQINE